MDCKYINQNDIHERYLLDRLNESEKAKYLSHLKSCKTCKNTLESEKEVVGSILHFGKSEMKSEIARQVAEIKSKEKNVSWDMILKVAAIFFFLVITPGLVYYYQSVESPKITELYNFDEAIKQEEETELVKVDKEKETVEKLENILIDDSENTGNGNISDVLGSAGGIGAGSSIQSVGMAKPAKKSADRSKTTAALANEDDISYGIEQPASPAPQSTSPELDKFNKPENIIILEPKANRALVVDGVKSSKKIHPLINETRNQKMPAEKGRAIDESKSEDYSSATTEDIIITKLDYKFDDQSIIVNLIPLSENSDFYFQSSIPDSFPVLIKKTDKVNLEMDWYVNLAFTKINSNNILLNIEKDNLIFVKIKNTKSYQIDLKSDTTKAFLIH